MSKGSNRRPGTGYGAGYDGIDWGRKDVSEVLCNITDAAISEAIREYGAYPGKVWHWKKPDGSLFPADGGAPLGQPKTCQNCKHWTPVHGDCENSEVIAFIENGNGGLFRPPAGWGCNSWERKV